MKVFYKYGSNWRYWPELPPGESSALALSYNNWDDFGRQTTLNAVLYFENSQILKFSLKLFLRNVDFSAQKLNSLCESGWDGFFPIPGEVYVSVPSDIDLYDVLISKIGQELAANVLLKTRDAGYLSQVVGDLTAKELVTSQGFDSSPLREVGARKAYEDGWKIFTDKKSTIRDFMLYVDAERGALREPISFKFNSTTLPSDINVLIGPNGVGKSYTIKKLVEYWLGVDEGAKERLEGSGPRVFDRAPNIAKLILISYSPFEDFEIDLSNSNLQDKEAYKYFGFRQKTEDQEGNSRISISRNLPAADSVLSICKAIADDERYSYRKNWIGKADAISEVLSSALEFEWIALELSVNVDVPAEHAAKVRSFNTSDQRFIVVDQKTLVWIQATPEINDRIKQHAGVVLLNKTGRVELSSGQRLFCYIVINIVGQIQPDSLVIVDEPELFLHPTLETEFVSLLKKVLAAFESKAILATHSATIARETPAKCMHVYKRGELGLEIDPPPFETFGGDIQRISSYVFGDNRVSKPFAKWVDLKIRELGSKEVLLEMLKDEINHELLIRIKNSNILHDN